MSHSAAEEVDVIPGVSKSLLYTIKLLELQNPYSGKSERISRHDFEVILRDWMFLSRRINERIRDLALQSGYTLSAAGQLEELSEHRRKNKSIPISIQQNNATFDILVKALSSKTPDKILELKDQRCNPSTSTVISFSAHSKSLPSPKTLKNTDPTSICGHVLVSTAGGNTSLSNHISGTRDEAAIFSGPPPSNRRSYIPKPKTSPVKKPALESPIKLSSPPSDLKNDIHTTGPPRLLSMSVSPTKQQRVQKLASPKTPTPRPRAQTLTPSSIKPLHSTGPSQLSNKRLSLHACAAGSPVRAKLPGVWR